MKYNAVIFDLDGILIDSMPIWKKSIKEKMTEQEVEFSESLWQEARGRRIDEIVLYWKKNANSGSKLEINRTTNEILNLAIHKVKKQGQAKEGVYNILKKIKAMGIPVGLASSSYKKFISAVLEKLDITSFFSNIHSAEDEKYGKPHPSIYINSAKQMNVNIEECLVFEDSLNGVISAKAAKAKCVAVPETKVPKEEFCIADKVIYSLNSWKA